MTPVERLAIHLVAMPWAPPLSPSVQIGALKAHLDRAFAGRVPTRTYPAFFTTVHVASGADLLPYHQRLSRLEETPYLLATLDRFVLPRGAAGRRRREALFRAARATDATSPSLPEIRRLARATDAYLDARLVPELGAGRRHVVGFTLNFDQLYASAYAALYLQAACPDQRLLFVFGGATASHPRAPAVLAALGLDGLVVLGEGEARLEALVGRLLEDPDADPQRLSGVAPGVLSLADAAARRHETQAASLPGQLPSIESLPLPDFGDYMAELEEACEDPEVFLLLRRRVSLAVEGSRGCFAKCDFCGLNSSWSGFRRRSAAQVVADAQALVARHGVGRVTFVDNVCDTWAEAYADALIGSSTRLAGFMELRAHHPEAFWTKLALAGISDVQIGVEALSGPLLDAMKKRTTVIQNLVALKCLRELGISSGANLITRHPLSTVADVEETTRVVREIPHLGRFNLSSFWLVPSSPLHEGLDEATRDALQPRLRVRLPELGPLAFGYDYESPPALQLTPAVRRAWDRFVRSYVDVPARAEPPSYRCERIGPGRLRLIDGRDATWREHVLEGEEARVYDLCHTGPKAAAVAGRLAIAPEDAARILARLEQERLILRVGEHVIALALRPREELFARALRAPTEAAPEGLVRLGRTVR